MSTETYTSSEDKPEGFLLFLLLAISFLLIVAALAMIYFMDAVS